jgi:hypothetical protein
MKVGRGADQVKPAGGCIVMRTTSLTVITAVTAVLGATAAGCSSHRSPVGAVQSVVSSSAPASTQLTSAPTSAGPAGSAGSASVGPASQGSTAPSVPSVAAPSVAPLPLAPAPTASVPRLGTHALTVVAGLGCPDVGSPGQATAPSPKPLPPSVTIKAVVRCEIVQRSYPGLGGWTVQLSEVADSGLGPFLADLRAPSDAMPSGIMCPDFRILVPWFELVDAASNAINVRIPTDQCGAPNAAAITALQALHFRVTDAVRIAAAN